MIEVSAEYIGIDALKCRIDPALVGAGIHVRGKAQGGVARCASASAISVAVVEIRIELCAGGGGIVPETVEKTPRDCH